jgi:hypothetical protein
LRNRARLYAVIVSICLHVLLFLLWAGAARLNLIATTPDPGRAVRTDPLVFEIEPPREVVETPEDAPAVDAPEEADYLSDRNARARNAEPAPDREAGAPFSRGDFDIPELPQAWGAEAPPEAGAPGIECGRAVEDAEEVRAREGDGPANAHSEPVFPRELLDPEMASVPRPGNLSPRAEYDNRLSTAADAGGLSFNTYDWDFAPYMIGLKRKIERNVIPPLAFSSLGMIEGESVVRFRIDRGGRLRSLEVLGYTGHRSLVVTSRRAVESSAPFALLPPDFPEQYLEVTARFSYHVGPGAP